MGTIILIILILALVGVLPTWPHSRIAATGVTAPAASPASS